MAKYHESKKPIILLLAILIFASIGAYMIFSSKAATVADADFNDSGKVDISDLSILATNYGKQTGAIHSQGDTNADGKVDISDLSILATYYGQSITTTPTPTGQPANSINVKDYGAKGDGVTDDLASINTAINYAKTHDFSTVYLPEGTYYLASTLEADRFPDDITIVGDGLTKTWLKGKLWFGSNQTYKDLKIGTQGYSTRNAKTAINTQFIRCQFRGGGSTTSNSDKPVIQLGFSRGYLASHITFLDSNIESNLGVEDASFSIGYDNVYIQEHADVGGAHNEYITFERCHFGVSNGVRTGSPRMDFEAYTAAAPTTQNRSNITIKDCIFEKSDWYNIDLSSAYKSGTTDQATGTNIISGNILKGAGKYTICIEYPQGVIVENNTIYRGGINTFKYGRGDMTAIPVDSIVRNNTFDLDTDNGFPHPTYAFMIKGGNNTWTNNTIYARTIPAMSGFAIFGLGSAYNSNITNNTIYWSGIYQDNRWKPSQFSDSDGLSHDNVLSPNIFTY